MFQSSNRREFQRGLDVSAVRSSRLNAQRLLRRRERGEHLSKRARVSTSSTHSTNTCNPDTSESPKKEFLFKYVADIMHPSDEARNLKGLRAIRQLLSVIRDPPTKAVSDSGVIPKVIQYLYIKDVNTQSPIHKECQFEASWIVTNIAACEKEYTLCLIKHGAIEGLSNLLQQATDAQQTLQTVWALANFASEMPYAQTRFLKCNIIGHVLHVLDSVYVEEHDKIIEHASWCLSNMFRSGHHLQLVHVKPAIPVLIKLLRKLRGSRKDDTINNCLWALSNLSNLSDDIIQCMCEASAISVLMQYLHGEVAKYQVAMSQQNTKVNTSTPNPHDPVKKMNFKVYKPSLRTIGNILSCGDELTQMVLDAGYLDVVEPFLGHFQAIQRKEMLWSLSNILAGTHQQIEMVLSRPSIMNVMVNAAYNDTLFVRREACWCISNAVAECITDQKKRLAEYGAIRALCKMLEPSTPVNDQTMKVIVEGLESFLSVYGPCSYNPFADEIQECKGLDYLEERCGDEKISEDTWNDMCRLMKKYWGCDEEHNDQENKENTLTAAVDTATNQFAFGTNTLQNTINVFKNNGATAGFAF